MNIGSGSGVRVGVEVSVGFAVWVGVRVRVGVGVIEGFWVGVGVWLRVDVAAACSALSSRASGLLWEGAQADIKRNNPKMRNSVLCLHRFRGEELIMISNFPIHQSKRVVPILNHSDI